MAEESTALASPPPLEMTGREPEGSVRPGPVYLTVLAIASCGLIYELLAATIGSYLLGDTVTQFSLVIGVYLTSLGIGSWLTRYVERGVARRFVEAEIAVSVLGGLSAPFLFLAFASPSWFRLVFFGLVSIIGILVGLEIPLLLRLLRQSVSFKELVAQVLTFDYLGALAASVLFPMVCIPRLGLVRTSIVFGLLNAAVAFTSIHIFRSRLGRTVDLRVKAGLATALLLGGLVFADRLSSLAEESQFADEVVFARSSPYQRIVLTRNAAGFQLFLNGHLQFSSVDEYRYHEALVHPAFAVAPRARRVAVLGGGDGLAVREVLRHPAVESVTLVDLDPEMTRLARENPLLLAQNEGSLLSPKVTVVNEDAMTWLQDEGPRYDIFFLDFPDPHGFGVGKLYTTRFYRLVARRLEAGGVVAVQSTSPLFARRSFWIVDETLRAAGFATRPYHVAVPSFGEWGFVLAAPGQVAEPSAVPAGLRYISTPLLASLFVFPPDMSRLPVPVNRLDNQVLVRTYESEWRKYD